MSYHKKIDEIKAQIAELNRQIETLEKQSRAFHELSIDQQLAITLHDTFCTHNHIDGCGWQYEGKTVDGVWQAEWVGHEHKQWREKAYRLISECDKCGVKPEDAIKLASLIRGY